MITVHGDPKRLLKEGKLFLRGVRLETEPFRVFNEKRTIKLGRGVNLYPVYPLSEIARISLSPKVRAPKDRLSKRLEKLLGDTLPAWHARLKECGLAV